MKTIRVNNWPEFVSIADNCDIGPVPSLTYAFRGQANATWTLTPKLLRHIKESGLSESQALETERQALIEFQSQAHLYISTNILTSTTDAISWWTLMQHHGAPTRLLDWTHSIYIAAYFAVSSEFPLDGAVWILHTNTIHSRIDKLHGPQTSELPSSVAEIDEKFLQEGMPHTLTLGIRTCKSDRMVVQQGGFSVSRSVLGEHGEIIGQAIPENDEVFLFAKLIIPSNLKLTFLRKLRNVNITGGSLFPGLDGLARSVAELVMLGGK